ncbi:MAG TPA: hypothetical protein PKY87_14575 [Terricaulis sp.]|nr:hypothetical protein [Terricaulis sp.]
MSAVISPDMAAALRAASIVAGQHLMPNEAAIFRATRGAPAEALARQEVAYLLNTACSLSINRVCKALGRDRSTISYSLARVEEALSEPDYASYMERLSGLVREAVQLGALRDEALAKLAARELRR